MPKAKLVSTSLGDVRATPFPGHIVKVNEPDEAIVKIVQRRLNKVGCGPLEVDGDFGSLTKDAVKLFQIRFTDSDGLPLVVDGEVGSITWAALFGEPSVIEVDETADELLARALDVAASQVGVMEKPLGSNRGPEVDRYIRAVGLNPAGRFPWCAAFLYFCFEEAAQSLDRSNPVIKTAGVLDHWSKAGQSGITRITKTRALGDVSLVRPGQIFIIDYGGGAGHTGLIESVAGGKLVTIEGNTNDGGSREGIGVFRRAGRKIANINKGFIDYSGR